MSLTDADLVRALTYTVLVLLGGFGTIAWWAVRWLASQLDRIMNMVQRLEIRVARIEARAASFADRTWPGGAGE